MYIGIYIRIPIYMYIGIVIYVERCTGTYIHTRREEEQERGSLWGVIEQVNVSRLFQDKLPGPSEMPGVKADVR